MAKAAAPLATLDKATRMLATCCTVEEAIEIADIASAAQHFAKKARLGLDAQNYAAEIKIRAERKAGEFLAKMEKVCGSRGVGKKVESHEGTPLLSEIGVTKSQSHRWQAEAAVPEEEFNAWVKETHEAGKELSSKGAYQLGRRSAMPDRDDEPESVVVLPGEESSSVSSLDELENLKFGTIYADPPWKYGNQSTRASTDNHYSTMSVDELCNMPVEQYAADDAHLHLWTTNAFLPDAFRVMQAWGFEYRSCYVWVKPQMGIGNYWRVSHEFMLLGIRGNAKRFLNRSQLSWGQFDRTKHSAKPEEIRQIIEYVSPGPFLELFGRRLAPGWTVMGNQIERTIFDQAG